MRRFIPCLVLSAVAAACGGGSSGGHTGFAPNTGAIEIAGRVAIAGAKGSVLLFAYTDLAPADDPAGREPASVSIVNSGGGFDMAVPGSGTVTLVFLADSANDGVIDPRDPTAVLTAPELAELQPGDRVQISDATVDFARHAVTATIDVLRSDPPRTPTPVP